MKEYGYHDYNKVYDTIPDDDSKCLEILAELKKNFATGVTRDISFRKKQL